MNANKYLEDLDIRLAFRKSQQLLREASLDYVDWKPNNSLPLTSLLTLYLKAVSLAGYSYKIVNYLQALRKEPCHLR
jgi:hypothetical protein